MLQSPTTAPHAIAGCPPPRPAGWATITFAGAVTAGPAWFATCVTGAGSAAVAITGDARATVSMLGSKECGALSASAADIAGPAVSGLAATPRSTLTLFFASPTELVAFDVPMTSGPPATVYASALNNLFGQPKAILSAYQAGVPSGPTFEVGVAANSFGGYVDTTSGSCPAGTWFDSSADSNAFMYQAQCSPW